MRKIIFFLLFTIGLILSFLIYQKYSKQTIWQPRPNTSWQWQLSGKIDSSYDVEMYDIDLFDTPKSTIKELQKRGIVVICYFSAGSYEDWRPDKDQFSKELLGNKLQDWDEQWLDISNLKALAPIMTARLDLAKEKGCDGVEPDNVDAYQNNTGFQLSAAEQLRFNKFLAKEAHKRGLSIGLKNNLDQVEELVKYYDWALNEQCFEYGECHRLLVFIKAQKAVFGVEYNLEPAQFCPKSNKFDFDWLYKNPNIDSFRASCR